MTKSQKQYAELKKSYIKQLILFDRTYMKF